jgi:hypothetical protein
MRKIFSRCDVILSGGRVARPCCEVVLQGHSSGYPSYKTYTCQNFSICVARSHWKLGSECFEEKPVIDMGECKREGLRHHACHRVCLPQVFTPVTSFKCSVCVCVCVCVCVECSWLWVNFWLATAHCCWAMHRPSLQQYAATMAWYILNLSRQVHY